jgi:hypothetical protein
VVVATIPVVLDRIQQELGEERFAASKFTAAAKLFEQMIEAKQLPEFLTSVAYASID